MSGGGGGEETQDTYSPLKEHANLRPQYDNSYPLP